jgi:hypothetical protein
MARPVRPEGPLSDWDIQDRADFGSDPTPGRHRRASKGLMREYRRRMESDLAAVEANLAELRRLDPDDLVVNQDGREVAVERAIERLERERRLCRIGLGLDRESTPIEQFVGRLKRRRKP